MHHMLRQKPDNTNVIRNSLFRLGQQLESNARLAFNQAKKDPTSQNRITLACSISVLDGYVQSRSAVSPYVAIDVALQTQQGLVKQVNRWLDSDQV
jgi:hypothetical protein